MPDQVIIIVPSQGHAAKHFESVAKTLKKQVYKNAIIVKTTVSDSGGTASVAFNTLDGHPFDWSAAHDVSRVLTVSHSFAADGPNLALTDDSVPVDEHQPWGSKNGEGRELTDAAKAFWTSVGSSMSGNGKIMLLGCSMGSGAYAANVAKATGRHVFAATDKIAAGDTKTSLKYVRSIEKGNAKKPMKDFSP
jgi:hypothetical protein